MIIPKDTSNSISKIGFAVYEYVDFSELRKSFLIDYLDILIKVSWLLLILAFVGYVLGELKGITYILLFVYVVIFLILIIKFLLRIKYFIRANKIVITDKGILLSDKIIYWKDKAIKDKLKVYEDIFKEPLFGKSMLDNIISKLKDKVFQDLKRKFDLLFKMDNNFSDARAVGVLFIIMIIYAISIFVFYWVGYIFIWTLSYVVVGILRFYLKIKGNLEYKIYSISLFINDKLVELDTQVKKILKDFERFKSGDIYNLGKFVEKSFKSIYSQFSSLYKQLLDLTALISKSKYQDLINFSKTKDYLFSQYNKPLDSLLQILDKYIEQIQVELVNLKKMIQSTDLQEYKSNLQLKENSLFMLKKSLEENKARLEKLKI